MKKIFIITLIFLLILPFVSSVALLTGKEIIYFEPGLEKTIPFTVNNNDKVDKIIELRATTNSDALKGILDEMISFRENDVIIKKGEKYEFIADLKLPESLPYGTHEIYIRISDTDPNKKQTGMIFRGIVSLRITMYSLYSGKYVVGNLMRIEDVNIGEVLKIGTEMRNAGTEDIENLRSRVDIYDGDILVGSAYSDYSYLAFKNIVQPIARLSITKEDYEIGQYTAKAYAEYDGETKDLDSQMNFNVGTLSISILNITSRKFENNKINKFDIEVESKWNKPADVYADIILTDLSGVEIIKFKTETVTVGGWGKGKIPVYFDAKGIENDNYMLKIILNYEEKTSLRTFIVHVTDTGDAEIVDEMPGMPKTTLLIVVLLSVIVLLLAVIAGALFFKRKKGKK